MRPKELLRGEVSEVEHCPTRSRCPIGALCGVSRSSGETPLFPQIKSIAKGDLVWTDLRFERCINIVQEGVFVCFGYTERDSELPAALFGNGVATGIAELYTPRKMSETYYLRALIPGRVCAVSAKPLKRALESMPIMYAQRVMNYNSTSQFAAAFAQMKVLSQHTLYEKILMLFMVLRNMMGKEDCPVVTFGITHEDIAMLVASDRVSATRVLHRMKDEGCIDLGYKSVVVNFDRFDRGDLMENARMSFLVVEPPGAGDELHRACEG